MKYQNFKLTYAEQLGLLLLTTRFHTSTRPQDASAQPLTSSSSIQPRLFQTYSRWSSLRRTFPLGKKQNQNTKIIIINIYCLYIYKVVISICLPVCLFECPIISNEPLDRFVSNFDWVPW